MLIKSVTKTTEIEAKKPQKDGFLGMLLGILDAILSGNMLTSKGTITT